MAAVGEVMVQRGLKVFCVKVRVQRGLKVFCLKVMVQRGLKVFSLSCPLVCVKRRKRGLVMPFGK